MKQHNAKLSPNWGESLIVATMATILLVASQPVHANAVCPKSPKLTQAKLIVQLNGVLTAQCTHALTSLGARIYRQLPIISSVAVHIPAQNQARLTSLPFVKYVSLDNNVEKSDAFTCNSSLASSVASVSGLNGTFNGKGVTIAVVDSGISPNLDLTTTYNRQFAPSRIVGAINFEGSSTSDVVGHGTHVSGIIAGDGLHSSYSGCTITYTGIAPQANLLNVRVLSDTGSGSVSDVVAGIQWVVSNQAKYNVRVMNVSLGQPVSQSYLTDPLCQAVEAAWKAGIVVVCAAGNSGRANSVQTTGTANEGWGTQYGSIQSPGNDPYVITVGATKQEDANRAHDLIATYSSRGPAVIDHILKPDIIAPGNHVVSTEWQATRLSQTFGSTNIVSMSTYTTAPQPSASDNYFVLSGTSMAAPVVAGAAALMLQKDPTLTPDTVKARLMLSADKWADPKGNFDPNTYGAGYLNIVNALNNTYVAKSPSISPFLLKDTQGNVHISTTAIGGTNVIWGSVSNLNSVWGANAVWSSNTIANSNVIWGTNVIWGSKGVKISSSDGVDLTATAINGEK